MATFDNEKQVLLDRYLNDELTAAEKLRFEKEMEADEALKSEVILHQKIVNGIREDAALRERLRRIDKQTAQQSTPEQKTGKRLWLRVAAAAAVIFLIGLVAFLNWPSEMSNEELFAQNYELLSPLTNRQSDPLDPAWDAYSKKDFATALSLFETSGDKRAWLYAGICQMELGQFEKGISLLGRAATEDLSRSSVALWYKGLCEVKLGRDQAARKTLGLVVADEEAAGAIRKKAEQILKGLGQ